MNLQKPHCFFAPDLANMKKTLLQLFFALSGYAAIAQQAANDSISLGASYVNDVYYSFENGTVGTAQGNNWHIALSTRPAAPPMDVMRSATVATNSARGVLLFKSNQNDWSTFTADGYNTWPKGYNSDTSWDVGAFNANRTTNGFDFGWGMYNMQSHNVEGNSIFLLAIVERNGPSFDTTFKKIMINKLAYDTQWVFTFSNVDGSDSNYVTIGRGAYAGKLFVYYDLKNKQIVDREPTASWDVLFTRYTTYTTQFGITQLGTSTGVLHHPSVRAAKVDGLPEDSITIDMANFSKNINTIGTDWKANPGPGVPFFSVYDSTVYFVRLANNKQYRLAFRRFDGSSNGRITFYKNAEANYTGLLERKILPTVNVYPNPATNNVTVETGTGLHTIALFDITGRCVKQLQASGSVVVDLNDVKKGLYFIQVDGFKAAKLIVE